MWRISLEFNLFDEKSDFSYQKALFKNNLDEIIKIIKNTNHNYYVFHIVVPHLPFGFEFVGEKKCTFNNNRTLIVGPKNALSNNNYLNNYYQEVACTNLYLKNFFEVLKDQELYETLDILVTSDTGIGIAGGETKSNLLQLIQFYLQ